MKRYFFYSLMVLVFACKGRSGTEPVEKKAWTTFVDTTVRKVPKGSYVTITGKDTSDPQEWFDLYVPRASFNFKNYSLTIQTWFSLPSALKFDSSFYFNTNLLILRDNRRKVADTLEVGLEGYDTYGIKIEDMSDSLHYKSLVLQLKWTGSSDMDCSSFIEFRGDSLKSLFYIEDLYKIRRQDENTITGFVTSRDEVVSGFQHDYPFTLTLSDYELEFKKPEKQYIGYLSEVLIPINAYRFNENRDTVRFTIKMGTKITIDTLYRNTKTVRMLINNSIPAYIETEKLNYENIRTLTAG